MLNKYKRGISPPQKLISYPVGASIAIQSQVPADADTIVNEPADNVVIAIAPAAESVSDATMYGVDAKDVGNRTTVPPVVASTCTRPACIKLVETSDALTTPLKILFRDIIQMHLPNRSQASLSFQQQVPKVSVFLR